MTRERLVVGAVHYAAGPTGRMSHGLCVVVTAPAGHGAPMRSRQLSARIISFLMPSSHPLPPASLRAAGEGRGEGALDP
jgi:hypothetical protein